MSLADPANGDITRRAHWRAKAAHCLELAQQPKYGPQAKILIRMAQRFLDRARGRGE
jgi:hypothetical protein